MRQEELLNICRKMFHALNFLILKFPYSQYFFRIFATFSVSLMKRHRVTTSKTNQYSVKRWT